MGQGAMEPAVMDLDVMGKVVTEMGAFVHRPAGPCMHLTQPPPLPITTAATTLHATVPGATVAVVTFVFGAIPATMTKIAIMTKTVITTHLVSARFFTLPGTESTVSFDTYDRAVTVR